MANKIKMTAVVHPFKSAQKRLEFNEGTTVRDMVLYAQPDTTKLRHAIVFVNGKVIPKKIWSTHKPAAGEIVEVRACPVPHGGGGGGGKDILRVVLTIAVVALAVATGGAALGLMGFSAATIKAAGVWVTLAKAMYVGVVSAAGMLAVNALCPTTTSSIASLSNSDTKDSNTLFIEGASNSIDPFGVVPVTLGKYRQTPRQGSKPYTEMIGDNQYIRMLFVWGVGPLEIDETSLKIGDTLLSEFADYQIERREGYEDDEALTLFPEAISEEDFTVALTAVSDWITRTTTVNADEISADISFSGGLVEYDANGNKQPRSVNVEIQYRKTDSEGPWSNIDTAGAKFQATCDPSWLNTTGGLLTSITFTGKKTSALRYGIRWGVPERAQYDVRWRRTTADTDSTLIADLTYWTALRSIKIEGPIDSPVPLAVTALVIKSTDQLNGVIDDFSGIVTRVCPDWDVATQTWITRATQNPASMFRFVLQGNGIAEPLDDDRIDLEALQDWHEFCDDKGFKFNQVRDYSASVWETLRDICAAGRAAPTMVDGKWSVVIDQEQDAPVSVITPRNSFDFSSEKFFLDPPHGWRIQFPNEDEDYSTDEYRVYRDGYNDDNATKFETLNLLGVTDPDQIYRLGRWRIAQALNQPERWTFKQDMEFLTYRRGDWIKIAHDVMIVGLAQGRVKSVVYTEGAVISIELDEEVTMEAGKTYGVVIRTLDNPSLSAQVVTSEGTTNSLIFSEEIAGVGSPAEPAISIGDIVCFGEFGEETEDATVISITPDNNLQATIIAVPYRPAIYVCDTEEIPEFVTKITAPDAIPAPSITSIVSDETAMVISSTGTLKIRVGINFDPLNTTIFGTGNELIVQIRQNGTNEAFYPAVIEEQGNGYVFIGDVRTKEVVDIRLRFKVNGKLLPGPWTTVTGYIVIGRSSSPAPLANMTISAFGAQAMIRWDKPSELDVICGGEVEFRHSQDMEDAEWGNSVSIGQAAMARTLFAVLPLKAGTYLARVYDVDGNPSETITSVTTKQASINSFASVITLDEAPSFLGTHDGTEIASNSLKLIDGTLGNYLITEDDSYFLITEDEEFLICDGLETAISGTYYFPQGIDLGSVKNVRLTTRIGVSIYSINDLIDSRLTNIDDWQDIDAALTAGADAKVYVRHTDEDPSGSGIAWSSWERLDSAEFEARAFEFYIVLERDSADYNILVSELGIDVDELA
jgi:sulfur carrier protein ThiS